MNYKEQYVHMYRSFIKRVGSESLLDWLMSTDFFEAPASTKYHGNFPGGLAIHSLNVFERMRNNCVYEFGTECGGAEPFPKENLEPIAIVSLLHDVCKAEFYKQDFRNQKIYSEHGTQFDKRGAYSWESVPFYTIEEKFPFGHGEKSVFLINEHMCLEDNQWSLAVELIQKEPPWGRSYEALQARHYRQYLLGIQTCLLNRLPSIGTYTGPWTSGILRKEAQSA